MPIAIALHAAAPQARIALQAERPGMNSTFTRRDFVRLGAGAMAAGAVLHTTLLDPPALPAQSPAASAGRKIRFVSIGTGIRGCDLLRSARARADRRVRRNRGPLHHAPESRAGSVRRGYSHNARLSFAARPQRRGCGHRGGSRLSASPRGSGLRGRRQRRLLREAHVAQRGRWAGHGGGGAERQAHLSGGQPARQQHRLSKKPRRSTSPAGWARSPISKGTF